MEKDQDTKVGPASRRLGGVWEGQTKEMGSMPTVRVISPGRIAEIKLAGDRREASQWVNRVLKDVHLPTGSDVTFRGSLRDGSVLIRLMNEVLPGAVKKEPEDDVVHGAQSERERERERVQSFIAAAKALAVPDASMFCLVDLEAADDRPQVTAALLWLKRLHEGRDQLSPAPRMPFSRMTGMETPSPGRTSMRKLSPRSTSSTDQLIVSHPPSSQQAPSLKQLLAPKASYSKQQAELVTALIEELDSRMHPPAPMQQVMTTTTVHQMTTASPSPAQTGVLVQVLENMVKTLSQEYEKRLCMKDQEISTAQAQLLTVMGQLDMMRRALGSLQRQVEEQQVESVAEAARASAGRVLELEVLVEEKEAHLQQLTQEQEELRQQLRCEEGQESAYQEEQRVKLEALMAELAYMDDLKLRFKSSEDENRDLYNQVQDLKGAIRVFCRIRPRGTTGDRSNSCIDVVGDRELATAASEARGTPRGWKFDKVYNEDSTQEGIYRDVQPLIRSVLDGYNVTIFAYGQTGSGKTHTMSGSDVHQESERGINFRALHDLFNTRDARSKEVDYTIQVQMLEIYNEILRDLLVEDAHSSSNKLEIQRTQPSGLNVPYTTKVEVLCSEDVMDIMARGSSNRHSAETKMNARSSRSHQVLTVVVDGVNRLTGDRTHGCLHLIDLAGSEKTDKSEAKGQRMTEANNINSSLSHLGSVMHALASKQPHIPYRNSRLTELLQDSLGGQAKVMMFMHVAPEVTSLAETNSTLQFAKQVSQVSLGQAKKHTEAGEIFKAHDDVQKLRQLLEGERVARARAEEELKQTRIGHEGLQRKLAAAQQLNTPARSEPTSVFHSMGPAVSCQESKPLIGSTTPMSRLNTAQPAASPLPGAGTPLGSIHEGQSGRAISHAPPYIPPLNLPSTLTPCSARPSTIYSTGTTPLLTKQQPASSRDATSGRYSSGVPRTPGAMPASSPEPTAYSQSSGAAAAPVATAGRAIAGNVKGTPSRTNTTDGLRRPTLVSHPAPLTARKATARPGTALPPTPAAQPSKDNWQAPTPRAVKGPSPGVGGMAAAFTQGAAALGGMSRVLMSAGGQRSGTWNGGAGAGATAGNLTQRPAAPASNRWGGSKK